MNRLITQRINAAVQKSLDIAINRFESKPIWGIIVSTIAINAMIRNLRIVCLHIGTGDFDQC